MLIARVCVRFLSVFIGVHPWFKLIVPEKGGCRRWSLAFRLLLGDVGMQLHKLPALIALCSCLALPALADTLTFVAQPASAGGDNTWFNAVNWFVTDSTGNLVPAGRVPLTDDGAIITGFVDLQAGGVRLQTLVVTNNSNIANGTISVANLQLFTSCVITNAKLFVLSTLAVGGTNCTLNSTTLSMLSTAFGTLQAVPPATESSLVLAQGAIVQSQGAIRLTDHSQITGGGSPQCALIIQPGGVLASTNSAAIRGSSVGHLLVDMSGVVRVEAGTLNFADGIDWKCSAGVQEFQAMGPSAALIFSNQFHVDSGVMTSFTGGGTNSWLSGASIDGLVQVSAIDSSTQLAGPGHLEILGPVSGVGTLHILGTANQGGVGSWGSGTISLSGVSVDSGANLLIGGPAGTSRQLAGCVITNSGSCTFWGGDLDFSQGAMFDNQTGATFLVQSDGVFSASAGGGAFNNLGTFQKTGSGVSQFGTTNSSAGPDFNNTGLLDLRAGQLDLAGGVSSGEFRQTQGTFLWFWGGTHTLNMGVTFTGTNAMKVSQGVAPATVMLNDSISLSQLELGANGTLDASSAPVTKPLQFDTLLSHDDGVISNGVLQVGTYQMLDQSGISSSTVKVQSALLIQGTNCTLQATTLTLPPGSTAILQRSNPGSGAVLNLNQGSVVDDQGQLSLTDGAIIAGGASPQNKLVIEPGATLISTNSTSIQGQTNAALSIENHGTVRVDAGTLVLAQGTDFNNLGTNEILSGTLALQGTFQQTQGSTMINSGATLTGTSFVLLGGVVSGSGTIRASVVNSGGIVSPGVAFGILSLGPGQSYQQGPLGTLSVELGGTNVGTGYDQLAIGGNASLDGELVVTLVNGFVPHPGQTFQVLTWGSLTGKFADVSIPPVSGTWVPSYSSNGLTLVLAGNLTLPRPSISGGTLSLSINTTPGFSYVVQATNELNPSNWQTASTFAGDGTTKLFTEPLGQAHRFYRVLLQ
jgi:hypothetical protein